MTGSRINSDQEKRTGYSGLGIKIPLILILNTLFFRGSGNLNGIKSRNNGESPEAILHNIRADEDTFLNGVKQFDDMAMLCPEYK